ncbi:hypothetical protein K0U27_04325 [archaeon]|nr:hypothetical protein [archaeon]
MFAGVTYFEKSFAQNEKSPHQQWKESADIDLITCKPGHILLLDIDGNPLCVTPSTYLKLIDRGYGSYDSTVMTQRPTMLNELIQGIVSDQDLMHHWHEMMTQNPIVMTRTADEWISHIRDKPDLLKNFLGPISSDPKIRPIMIDAMKSHPHMETVLKQHSAWMDSVHHPVLEPEMTDRTVHDACTWCTKHQTHTNGQHLSKFANHDRMMHMMHEMWTDLKTSQELHLAMLENPIHMGQMSERMMDPVLDMIMDDETLRQQMIDLLLGHQDFMNDIRHDNPEAPH